MEKYTLHTDGGSRGNPGPAGIGGVLCSPDGTETENFKEFIGIGTNNNAEYSALIKGLEIAKKHDVKNIECFLDSELVVKQLNGQYKVKNPDMKNLYDKVKLSAQDFDSVVFTHVKREFNKDADKLVNQALDAAA